MLLLFPPLTEARQFPYGSLPMLQAFLRSEGVRCRQRDLNIELVHRLLAPEPLANLVQRYEAAEQGSARGRYRLEMARFLRSEQAGLASAVFRDKDHDGFGIDSAVRFVRQGVELMLEDSLLARRCRSMDALSQMIVEADDLPADDLGAHVLKSMVSDAIATVAPRVVAISVPFYSQILPALLIARWAAEAVPGARVVLGGPQSMLRARELAVLPAVRNWVDGLGVAGGEATLLGFFRWCCGELDRSEVPDLLWTDNPAGSAGPRARLVLNDLPCPSYEGLPLRGYLIDEPQVGIVTCIGCYWGRCVFCSYGQRSLREGSYQELGPERLADLCRDIVRDTGLTRVNFVDENTNLRLVVRAMRILRNTGDGITFSTRNRMERSLLRSELCEELADLGCVLMSTGFETSSQRLLDAIHKGVRAEWYGKIIDNLHAAGIPLRVSVIGGLPGERPEEAEASVAFLREHADRIGVDIVQMLVLEPGTELDDDPAAFGIVAGDGQLRGNETLNYGMGRVGRTFEYAEGESFDARLRHFSALYRGFHPANNDEKPPRSDATGGAMDEGDLVDFDLVLLPWVRAIEGNGPESLMLVDLLWQRFFRLPLGASYRDDAAAVRLRLPSRQVDAIATAGLGRPVLRRELRR